MSKPDIHAETATEEDIVAVAEILAEHRGADNPVTSQEIADKTGLDANDSTPRTRGVIRKLQRQYDFPVAASSQGYYLIERRQEARKYLDDLDGRIHGIKQRKHAVLSSVSRRGVASDSSEIEQWIDDVRDDVEGDEDE